MKTRIENFTYRFARVEDVPQIQRFIYDLAVYEKLEHECHSTEDLLIRRLFEQRLAEVILYSFEGVDVGMSLFFTTYSTFEASGCMYLEDLYVMPEYRHRGFGKEIFYVLACICLERDYARLEWSCLDWNTPSLTFYQGLGAQPQSEWVKLRLDRDDIQKIGKE